MKKIIANRKIIGVIFLIIFVYACRKEMTEKQYNSTPSTKLNEQKLADHFHFNTYKLIDLNLKSTPSTTFRIFGIYKHNKEQIATLHSATTSFQSKLKVPAYFSNLFIEAYSEEGKKSFLFDINNSTSFIESDFKRSFKTSSNAIPTNVLYGVNSNKDFVLIQTSDYSFTPLPQLSAGTIACAVDTFNNVVYYHSSGTMYKYDIVSQVHSVAYTNANPFGGNNFPRMEFDYETRHLFLSNGSTSIKEVNPNNGAVVSTYTIQGLVNGSSGGDLTFPPGGDRYLACFSGLYKLDFVSNSNTVQATRISAENMPYQLTSAGYDRHGFLYACTNDAQSKLLKMDPNDGSYIIVKTFPIKINDLGSVVSFSNSICTVDSDNDGVCDELDDFPTDSTTCCAQYTPSQLGSGSLAFEDLWPSNGDYDFNDLVVGYNYVQMRNTQDELVKIKATFQVKAVGASYHNGFGFQLALNPDLIKKVTGAQLQQGIVSVDAKGLESGQSKATVIVFEDAYDVINHVGGAYINTDPIQPLSTGQKIEIIIELNQSVSGSFQPENPFIFVNGDRSHEVHLADQPPTDLMNNNLFGQIDDHSNPNSDQYYKNDKNVPWAIDISHNFRYPREKKRIDDGYNYIVHWALSGGSAYSDWYKDNSGYRNTEKLYMKH